MRAGSLMKITFRSWGPSLEAVLDRLPTAKVIEVLTTSTVFCHLEGPRYLNQKYIENVENQRYS